MRKMRARREKPDMSGLVELLATFILFAVAMVAAAFLGGLAG